MIDKALGIAATFDWISPVLALGGNLLHGGGYGLNIVLGSISGSCRDVQKLLSRQGVTNWAPQIVGGTFMLNVRKGDAFRACRVLDAHGIVVENPPGPIAQPRQRKPAKKPLAGSSSPFRVFDIFGTRCQYCGVRLSPGARTCDKCGAPT